MENIKIELTEREFYDLQLLIEQWKKDENISLDEMYKKAVDEGLTNCRVETQETLRKFICRNVRRGYATAPLLQSIEDDTAADYFIFNCSGWTNLKATPIYTKEEMAEALYEALY